MVAAVEVTQSLLQKSTGELQWLQEEDPTLNQILKAKAENQKPSTESMKAESTETQRLLQQWDQLRVVHGSLYHDPGRDDGALQWIVPRCVRKELLWALHNSPYSGHLGEEKTLGRLRERYYWPGHYNDVTNWCRTCESCARRKMPTPK